MSYIGLWYDKALPATVLPSTVNPNHPHFFSSSFVWHLLIYLNPLFLFGGERGDENEMRWENNKKLNEKRERERKEEEEKSNYGQYR